MFFSGRVLAQDLIIRNNNDTLKVLIVDMTKKKIKFIFNDALDADIFEISKSNVKQIIFENGSKLTIVSNPYEVSNDMIIKQKVHGIKTDVLAPLLNHYVICYERSIRVGLNLELKGAIIGTNANTIINHAEGYFLKGGIKFFKPESSYLNGIKYLQPLNGPYIKPEFIFSQFTRNENHKNYNYSDYALNIIFGHQRIFYNWLLFDYYVGFGYGIQKSSTESDLTYDYSHIFLGKKIPIIVSGGFTMGLVF